MARNRRAEVVDVDPAKVGSWMAGQLDEFEDDVWSEFGEVKTMVKEGFEKNDKQFIEVRLDNKEIQGKISALLVTGLVFALTFAGAAVLQLVKG